MRGIVISLALAALVTSVLASAQLPGVKIAGGGVRQRPRYAVLTVRYALIASTKMTLSTPAGSFTCPPQTFPITLPEANCTLTVSRGSTVALKASYLILTAVGATSNGKAIAGKQWGGACAGTIGDTCTIQMSEDRTVSLSPYAAP